MHSLAGGLTHSRRPARRRPKPGAAPGTLLKDPEQTRTTVRVFCYGPDSVDERIVDDPDLLGQLVGKSGVTWIDVDGLGELDKLQRLAEVVGLHPLAVADAVHLDQRPKIESYPEHDFIVVRMVAATQRVESEQLSIFLGDRFVVTVQGERPGDSLEPIRERIRGGQGRIRNAGASYLAYAILDAVTDYYFPVLDQLGTRLESLEEGILRHSARHGPVDIAAAKHDLWLLRALVHGLRDVLRAFASDAGAKVTPEARLFARDTLDHSFSLSDYVESYREAATALMEIHFSLQGQRMNEIMKFLTLISTLFIPLSFIAGVYGMNFDGDTSAWNMPELRWHYGYPTVMGTMLLVAAALVGLFWKRGWLR